MSQFYVACILGAEHGRIVLGQLHNGQLQASEVRRFHYAPVVEKKSVHWNIPQLYQEVLEGLRVVGSYEEPVQSVSCTSLGRDYLLFDQEGALITPAVHHSDPQTEVVRKRAEADIPWEMIYQETGTQPMEPNQFLHLGAEGHKRLKHACHALPLADGFNFLLGGEPHVEASMASATQLYNPLTHQWSDQVLGALKLDPRRLPPVVGPGTVLGGVRELICKETRLEETRVVASCSHELGAAVCGLPIAETEAWAFLRQGITSVVGKVVPQPIINEAAQAAKFSNLATLGEASCFFRPGNGLRILAACQSYWTQRDHSTIDDEMLSHLAGSATPFESLIDPEDPRFLEPEDVPLKIQAFCRESNQTVPRKPGPVYRCVLESLALYYRKLLQEAEQLAGTGIDRLFAFGEPMNMLLNHFTANALQRPVTVALGDVEALGNIIVQALALGDLQSVEEARALLRASCKMQTIVPHAHLWEDAYSRFVSLASEVPAPA